MSFFGKLSNKILLMSNSYSFYKNFYDKHKEDEKFQEVYLTQQKELNNKFKAIDDNFKAIDKKFFETDKKVDDHAIFLNNHLNEILDLEYESRGKLLGHVKYSQFKLDQLAVNIDEIRYAEVFNNTIYESNWLKDKSFSLNVAASNYSFMYILYRILNEVNSSNILELGLGQTTKMTTQYASYFDNVQLQVIEDNQSWTDTFSENLELTDNVSIDYCDVEEFDCNGTTSLRYSDLDKIIKDKKFDLIIIDGPKGFLETEEGPVELEYSRTNIWALIEKNLSKDFIIILDDFNRIGEQNTAEYICELISNKNIDYYTQVYRGSKNQIIITSEKNRFVTWF